MDKVSTGSWFISFISNHIATFFSKESLFNKAKASLLHLLFSAILIGSFAMFALSYWFPNNLLSLTGIKDVLIIIIIADLTLGPALTFIIFDLTKKSLKFDLSVIVSLQLTMFCYGAFTVYQAHPVYITYVVDRFVLVPARDVDPNNAKFLEYKKSKLASATLAYVEQPKDIESRNTIMFDSAFGGKDIDAYTENYLPYSANSTQILKKSWKANDISLTEEQKEILDNFLQKNLVKIGDLAFLPIQGKAKSMTFAINRHTAEPIGSIKISPWKIKK